MCLCTNIQIGMLRTEKVKNQGEYISYWSAGGKHGEFTCAQSVQRLHGSEGTQEREIFEWIL